MARINLNLVISVAIYLAIFSMIFFTVTPFFGICLLFLCFLGLGKHSLERMILLPFYLLPFMFLIRGQHPDNLILAILPDLFVVLSIVLNLSSLKIRKKNMRLLSLIALLSILIPLINLYHVGELSYLPVIIRQYTLPLLFLLVVINRPANNAGFCEEALFVSVISFSLVALLSLLNIAGIIFIPRSLEALYPFLNYVDGVDNIAQVSRTIENISFPRLNLFTGGALGSSGALFFILGLLALFNLQSKPFWLMKILSIPLLVGAVATLSASLIIAVMGYSLVFYFAVKRQYSGKLVGGIMAILIGFLLTSLSVMDLSPIAYFVETSAGVLVKHIFSLGFEQVMFGVGPRLTSAGYEFIPKKFVIDSGIFRVFVESGIIAFMLFLILLIQIFYSGFSASYYRNVSAVRPYLAIFVVFILLVHANMTALPPFYPLFCIACLGMSQRLDRKSS